MHNRPDRGSTDHRRYRPGGGALGPQPLHHSRTHFTVTFVCPGELVTVKLDFKQELECYSAKRNSPQVTDVPDLQYLMIDGHGDPNTAVYLDAVSALYPVAYKLKFAS